MRKIIAFVMLFALVAQVAVAQKKGTKQDDKTFVGSPPAAEAPPVKNSNSANKKGPVSQGIKDLTVGLYKLMANGPKQENFIGAQFHMKGRVRLVMDDQPLVAHTVNGAVVVSPAYVIINTSQQGIFHSIRMYKGKPTVFLAFATDKDDPDANPNSPDSIALPCTPISMDDGNFFAASYVGPDSVDIDKPTQSGGPTGANAVSTQAKPVSSHHRFIYKKHCYEIVEGAQKIAAGIDFATDDKTLHVKDTHPNGVKVVPVDDGTTERFGEPNFPK